MSHLLFGVVFVYGRNVQAADEEVGRVDVAGALVSQAAEEAQGVRRKAHEGHPTLDQQQDLLAVARR